MVAMVNQKVNLSVCVLGDATSRNKVRSPLVDRRGVGVGFLLVCWSGPARGSCMISLTSESQRSL